MRGGDGQGEGRRVGIGEEWVIVDKTEHGSVSGCACCKGIGDGAERIGSRDGGVGLGGGDGEGSRGGGR